MDARIVVLTNCATLDVRKSCAGLGADRVFGKTRQLEDFIAYLTRPACRPSANSMMGHRLSLGSETDRRPRKR